MPLQAIKSCGICVSMVKISEVFLMYPIICFSRNVSFRLYHTYSIFYSPMYNICLHIIVWHKKLSKVSLSGVERDIIEYTHQQDLIEMWKQLHGRKVKNCLRIYDVYFVCEKCLLPLPVHIVLITKCWWHLPTYLVTVTRQYTWEILRGWA